jgi:hypothetical protein
VNEPTGNSKVLLKYMISSCSKRQQLKSSLHEWERPLREQNRYRQLFESFDQLHEEMNAAEECILNVIQQRDRTMALFAGGFES